MTDWKFGDVIRRSYSREMEPDEQEHAMVLGPSLTDPSNVVVVGLLPNKEGRMNVYCDGEVESAFREWWTLVTDE